MCSERLLRVSKHEQAKVHVSTCIVLAAVAQMALQKAQPPGDDEVCPPAQRTKRTPRTLRSPPLRHQIFGIWAGTESRARKYSAQSGLIGRVIKEASHFLPALHGTHLVGCVVLKTPAGWETCKHPHTILAKLHSWRSCQASRCMLLLH